MNKTCVLQLENITKTYNKAQKNELQVLQEANLTINYGEVIGLIGPSGCGKSTLLQIAGLLDKPTAGIIKIDGQDRTNLSDKLRTKTRLEKIGFIYQFHHLLTEFSAVENVAIPLLVAQNNRKESFVKAEKLLTRLGLKDRLKHRPSELSGGEQQRVAIARALINDPLLLLADEPTGNLDPKTSDLVFNLLLEVAKETGTAILMVTHNQGLIKNLDKTISIENGQLV